MIRQGQGVSLSNHATKESAVEAATLVWDEEGGSSVIVDEDAVHRVDDEPRGTMTIFLLLLGFLLLALTLLIVISLVGAQTGFGA